MNKTQPDFRFDYSDNRPSWLVALDARVKLIITAFLLVAISSTLNPLSYSIISLSLLILFAATRPSLAGIGFLVVSAIFMLAITMTLHLLFNRTGDPALIEIAGLPLRKSALIAGIFYGWRVSLFLIAAFLVSRSVSADEMAQGFWRFLLPLEKIGFPANDIGLAILIALRFIPAIFRLQQQVKMAQTARGATFGGGLIARTRKMIPLLVPVTTVALRRSSILADALTVRGWGCKKVRTYYRHYSLKVSDYLVLILAVAWIALVIGLAL